ncbi:Peptidoglycan/LPS O-acetylase OafA/YrhL, contains acyltransferase and SGNH-hydrolase domains [Mucilaginibacter pineti]|uniref:Peptidoglycan/LPS O-acetylase OafA/YrhL, contains acyltransferase and SGNH-hydrolase domains n=1 Tax=Mucilaginibacter pineti TaxID=1391627 RepID=A0A1G6U031_9SPHI|nr:acyltransferase [Mucilaginibacter pineti]SDD33957.1 Peptidoglycan/LPS O-acetylase OafA/YrhL, contains acyltransferase and SGNH-hydrolase domains [Mucilaginibacter pineti]
MYKTTTSPSPLKSKQHFEILDGLRGIAAVAVVIFHFMEIAVPDYNNSFIAHAYLAVDFFFCLSGFVIAYAYDQKLKNIGLATFLKLRLIRLHPLVIIGSLIGLAMFIFDPFSNLYAAYTGKTLMLFLASCFMVPYPLVHERYFNLFHLNPPTWSLFWEYIANVGYALVLVKLRNKTMWVLLLVGAIALAYESFKSGYLGVGWGGDNITGGGVRVFYSFIAGILVYRSNWIIKSRIGFTLVGVLLLAAFLIPFSDKLNFIIDPVIVILYFPFLVALGAGAYLRPNLHKLCKFSGEISYPLYMIHYPFIWLFMSYVESKKPAMNEMIIVMITGVVLLIALAYLIMIWLDIPIRKYFKNRMEKPLVFSAK